MSINAAYLYDSVKLYAWALDKLLRSDPRPLTSDVIYDIASNGTRIIETIINNRTYKSEYHYIDTQVENVSSGMMSCSGPALYYVEKLSVLGI